MSNPDIVVLRETAHGMPIDEYAHAIRERLPTHDVEIARTPRDEHDLVANAPIVTGINMSKDLLSHAENLELFACLYAGTDHLPLDAFHERDVAVTNAGGVHGPNVSEWVLGQLLVFARRLHEGWRRQTRREWRHYQAGELNGSTVTIVGLGPIGRATVDRLSGFGVHTIGVRYTPGKGGPTDEVIGYEPTAFHAALAETDYLVLACPLTETTEGLIDEEAFKTLPPTSVIVNIARGPVVDTEALVAAIQSHAINGAALDVTDPEPLPADHELWGFENVLITPHNAGHTPAYYERVADILKTNVDRAAESGSFTDLHNQVQ